MYKITEKDIHYCDWLCKKFHLYHGRKPTEDQIQDAREAMCIAADKWDETKARTFISYARWWIYGYVQRNYNKCHPNPKDPEKYYMRSNDVYYQGRQENTGIDYAVEETTASKCESKDLVNKLTAAMPLDIEFVLRMQSRGVPISKSMEYLEITKSRQSFHQKINRWRNRNKKYINDLNGVKKSVWRKRVQGGVIE